MHRTVFLSLYLSVYVTICLPDAQQPWARRHAGLNGLGEYRHEDAHEAHGKNFLNIAQAPEHVCQHWVETRAQGCARGRVWCARMCMGGMRVHSELHQKNKEDILHQTCNIYTF